MAANVVSIAAGLSDAGEGNVRGSDQLSQFDLEMKIENTKVAQVFLANRLAEVTDGLTVTEARGLSYILTLLAAGKDQVDFVV